MEKSENGLAFVKADVVLCATTNKYWKDKQPEDNFWHFVHKGTDIRTHSGKSKVHKKCLSAASKLPFMDQYKMLDICLFIVYYPTFDIDD